MNTTRLMVVSSVHVGKGDMEERLLGQTKLGFLSVKFDNYDTGKLPIGLTRLMLVSSLNVGDEDTVEIPGKFISKVLR
jgi:hypothetical protein